MMSKGSQIYNHFKQRPGSQHIATANAVDGLIKWLDRKKPQRILEIGAGIGTMTHAILNYVENHAKDLNDPVFTSVEDNDFCLEQLEKNLGQRLDKVRLVNDLSDVQHSSEQFDFLIVDGGKPEDGRFASLVAERGVVFIEANRLEQRRHIDKLNRPYAYTNFYQAQLDSEGRPGSYHVFQFEPTTTERIYHSAASLGTRFKRGLARRLRPSTSARPTNSAS